MIDNLPIELLINILIYTDIKSISKIMCLNNDFKTFIKYYKWNIIYSLPNIHLINTKSYNMVIPKTLETYYEYNDIIDFDIICNNFKIPEDIIPVFYKQLNLSLILKKQVLSNHFLHTFYYLFDLDCLFMYQSINENILKYIIYNKNSKITKHQWSLISKYQKLSLSFIQYFENFIDWESLSNNTKTLSNDIISYYNKKLDWTQMQSQLSWMF